MLATIISQSSAGQEFNSHANQTIWCLCAVPMSVLRTLLVRMVLAPPLK